MAVLRNHPGQHRQGTTQPVPPRCGLLVIQRELPSLAHASLVPGPLSRLQYGQLHRPLGESILRCLRHASGEHQSRPPRSRQTADDQRRRLVVRRLSDPPARVFRR